MNAEERLDALARRNPEWEPWLALLGAILPELPSGEWDSAVPVAPRTTQPGEPLLARVTVTPDGRTLSRVANTLHGAAVQHGAASPCSGGAPTLTERDATELFSAAINGDEEKMARIASRVGAGAGTLHAVAALLAMPFLHACRRRWEAHIAQDWSRGYCPLCGAWPAFAEIRGVERSRRLRCGRCAAAWPVPCLSCTYCGTREHEVLGCLVPEGNGSIWAVETCNRCRGYLKALTSLRGTASENVMIEDLGGVELDLAAAARNYRRPPAAGYRLCVAVAGATESTAGGL